MQFKLEHILRDGPRAVRAIVVPCMIVALSGLPACTPRVDTHGFMPRPEFIEQLEPGKQNRDAVVRLMGSPSSISTFDSSTWYYITQRTKNFAFFKPEVVDQNILVIAFDEQGLLSDIRRYTLEDGLIVDPATHITPTAGKEMTFIQQLFGNIGRFAKPAPAAGPGPGPRPGP
ncbi:MAG: outer membrane protein assembly factor BamE [Alphaproteobacteria bacterium]|nr:outer membrane protein assembly factor BamE [Alphaproteobacteria bacterium]